jgi:hypothetical protein
MSCINYDSPDYDIQTAPSEWDVKSIQYKNLKQDAKLLIYMHVITYISPEYDTRTAPSEWDVK